MTSAFDRRRGTRAVLLFAALVLGVLPAHAQGEENADPVTRTAARDLALQGSEAFDQGQYQAALDFFQRAAELVRAPTITLMQARCLMHLGRWVEAIDTYEAVQHSPNVDLSNAAYHAAILSAAEEGLALKARLPRLKVELQGDASSVVEVWLDGRKLPSALIGVEIPCDPGDHAVEVRAPNGSSQTQAVVLGEGTRETVRMMTVAPPPEPRPAVPVAVKARPPGTPDLPGSQAAESPPPGASELSRTLGWVALVGGGASLGTGLVTGILALEKRSELDGVCHPGCPPAYGDDIDQFRTLRTVSWATISVGAVAAALGGYLIWRHASEKHSASLYLEPQGVRVLAAF